MGIYDRDYMREQTRDDRRAVGWPRGTLRWVLVGSVGLVALLGLVVVLAVLLPGSQRSGYEPEVNFPLDVNTATREELSQIPHLRQDVIDGILQSRPFASFADIDRVYGVGPVTLETLKEHLYIGTNASPKTGTR